MSYPKKCPPGPVRVSVPRQNARLRRELAAVQRKYAVLLAAAVAVVTASWGGDPYPEAVLVDALDELGVLPEFAPQLTDQALAVLGPAGAPVVGRRVG
ncbi:hypothetical protein I5Q34_08175 [Streptomyces sp. AV19]|uniref:hypothetical protein n=1 Tax=Streptomyces sp. AV19 TaxID=2793068 RepID=UPI0018FE0843|nr:hypothetical protein [Streptomyces sp. AV19]MBH1934271.1 hypothetical protein [Streptomyces sp. AV19]MDG4533418.1 hypothetical protein [Streptomyces sp. AV19]